MPTYGPGCADSRGGVPQPHARVSGSLAIREADGEPLAEHGGGPVQRQQCHGRVLRVEQPGQSGAARAHAPGHLALADAQVDIVRPTCHAKTRLTAIAWASANDPSSSNSSSSVYPAGQMSGWAQ